MTVVRQSEIKSYHAHIYFHDALEREAAEQLRQRIGERFSVQLGRWHDKPIGPHHLPMYQVAFCRDVFANLLPWLMLNRLGLTILVHPNTGNARRDHLVHAIWLGGILPIMRPEELPEFTQGDEDVIEPNTMPSVSP